MVGAELCWVPLCPQGINEIPMFEKKMLRITDFHTAPKAGVEPPRLMREPHPSPRMEASSWDWLPRGEWRLTGSLESLTTRVSHLQFFLISLLFQAGIYARHTKEQETYRFHMF